ncbi:MAG: hypothetical protein ACFFD1_03220 [Candidatus Thorarchaeota archaeon]
MFSIDYDEYRKKIEGIFQSEMEQSPDIDIKRILLVLTNPNSRQEILRVVSRLVLFERAQIKVLNGLYYYQSLADQIGFKIKTIEELIEEIKKENMTAAEIEVVREGDPFQGICEIVQTGRVDLIVIQSPFADIIETEKRRQNYLGKTIESLISFVMHDTDIPLIIIKDPKKLFVEVFNQITMLVSDWFNPRLFKTLIWFCGNTKSVIKILPYYLQALMENESKDKIIEIAELKIKKMIYNIEFWLKSHAVDIITEGLPFIYDYNRIIGIIEDQNPDLLALFVPRRPEIIPHFQDLTRKIETNIIIVPEFGLEKRNKR